jgi:hypothetical protein
MCVKAKNRYDACIEINNVSQLRKMIFEHGRIRELACTVGDVFAFGLIQPIVYEPRSRDIREGQVIPPSPFKKDPSFKSQCEVRLLLIPRDGTAIRNDVLTIELPAPTIIFKEKFRNYGKDQA